MMPMIKIDSLAEANKNADATQPLVAIASLVDSAQKKASLSLDLLKKALDTTPKKKQDTISKNKSVNKKVVDKKQPIKGEKKPDPKPLVKGEKKVVTKVDKKPKEVKKPQPEKKQEKVKKTTIKENNKVTNKTLNNTKKSAKAEMPKQPNSNNN